MKRARYQLSPKVSYRVLGDRAVLLDHGSGEILHLNAAAGRVLEAIEIGDRELTPAELEFAEGLRLRGHVIGADGDTASKPARDGSGADPEAGGLLERINRDAAAALIPLHCQLEVTYRCPLACRHCYVPPGAADPAGELTLPEIAELLDRLAELGALFLLLTGGEPFARADLEAIFEAARDRRFAVSFLTSGAGADRGLLARMAARGIDSLQVSLHGPDAATHDRLTGVEGSFDVALECLRAARDLGVRTRVGVTLTRWNAGRLGEIKALAEREGVPVSLGLYLEPRRDGSREPQAHSIGEDELRAALTAFPPRDAPRLRSRGPQDRPCEAGSGTLAVDPSGTVYPCLSLRLPVGSIREVDIGLLWRHSPVLDRLRRLRVADLEGCPDCEHRSGCNRCTGFAVSEGLGLGGHAPLDCVQARMLRNIKGQGTAAKGHDYHGKD